MLDKLTESQSTILRGALLGGMLLWGSQNLVPRPTRNPEATIAPAEQNNRGVKKETEGFLKTIRELLNHAPTTEEEVERCKEYLSDAEGIDPMLEPESYLEAVHDFEECKGGVSTDARIKLDEESTRFEPQKSYLLRCTPPGEEFSLKNLEVCEEVEERWAYTLSDELVEIGIEISPSYLSDFEFSETAGAWTNPGYAFELDSKDGAYHGTYQFTVHSENDGNWGFLMQETPEYFDDTVGDSEFFVHATSPSKLKSAFIREYNDVLAADERAEIAATEE